MSHDFSGNIVEEVFEGHFGAPTGEQGDKGDPGGNTSDVGLFTDIDALTIGAGINALRTSGYREVGKGAATYFRWAVPMTSLPAGGEDEWWVTSVDGAKWYPDRAGLNFYQFGAYGDYVRTDPDSGTIGHDDYPAFLNFRSYAEWARGDFDGHPNYRTVPRLRIEFGNYYSTDTFDFDFGTVCWAGDFLGGQNGGNGVEFTFADGKTGFRVHSHNTEENTTRAAAIGAFNSSFHNIVARTNGHGGLTDADGWRLRTPTHMFNCSAMNFIRHGVNLTAGIGAGGATEGNTNLSQIYGGHFKQNGGSGIHAGGADSNACVVVGVNCYGNGRWGIYDGSFLGNFHSGCHTDTNGILGTGGTTYAPNTEGAFTAYQIGGVWKRFAVIQGQEAAAKINAPSLTSTYWVYYDDVVGPATGWPAWVNNARDYFAGGSYSGDGLNNRTGYFGCYAEGGQPPAQGGLTTAFIQCFLGNGHVGGASLLATSDRMIGPGFGAHKRRTDGQYMNFLVGGNEPSFLNLDVLVTFGNEIANTPSWSWKANELTDWFFDYAHGTVPLYVTGPSTTVNFGRSVAVPYAICIDNLFIGTSSSARQIDFQDVAPTTGVWQRGDLVFNRSPTVGQPKGWQCTASGTPGTWVSMGNL